MPKPRRPEPGERHRHRDLLAALQPGVGDIPGNHYIESTPDSILWGYVPSVHDDPVLRMKSGETVTMELVSHEGIWKIKAATPSPISATRA